MKRALTIAMASLLPAALVLVATIHFYDARFRLSALFADRGGLLTVAGLAGGLYGLGLLLYISHLKERLVRSSGEREKIRKIGDYFAEKSESMLGDMEVLSAVRNLTGILADEGQIDTILTQVTQVVLDVTDGQEVTIFLVDDASRKPIPGAHRVGETCLVGDDLRGMAIDHGNVAEALELQTILHSMPHKDLMTLSVPLAADQEMLGAMRLTTRLTGDAKERAEQIDRIEKITDSLATHIALAIKTPILYNRAVIDGLTKLYTRRHFGRQIESLFSASLRLGKPMATVLLDIDNFKSLNDTYGHLFGDRVLAAVGELILASLRGYDTAYRYGGEEICLLLPDASAEQAFKVSERVRQKLARRVFRADGRVRVKITVSAGVAEFEPGMKIYHDLIRRADKALYASKSRGKNRTCLWEVSLDAAVADPPPGKIPDRKVT